MDFEHMRAMEALAAAESRIARLEQSVAASNENARVAVSYWRNAAFETAAAIVWAHLGDDGAPIMAEIRDLKSDAVPQAGLTIAADHDVGC